MTVNIHEAKTHLSRLLQHVLMGEVVIIAKAGKPIARVTPYSEECRDRVPGRDRGLFLVPKEFDDPLPEPPESFIPSRIERDGFTGLPIHHAHTIRTAASANRLQRKTKAVPFTLCARAAASA
jgi:prevent-host-death family protein